MKTSNYNPMRGVSVNRVEQDPRDRTTIISNFRFGKIQFAKHAQAHNDPQRLFFIGNGLRPTPVKVHTRAMMPSSD